MAKLKVPSLQHLSRNWRETPEQTADVLVRLARKPPNFSYAQLDGLVTDLLILKQPLEDVLSAGRRIKQDSVRENALELLPLIDRYFENVRPDFVQRVSGRMFPVARGLMVPFNPPLLYGSCGNLCFPWFSYWRSLPLSGPNLSLFVTAIDVVLKQDPDLEDAAFHILDLSAPSPYAPRTLKVIDSTSVPRLSKADLDAKLYVFAQGFSLAQSRLATDTGAGVQSSDQPSQKADDNQWDLFS